MIVYLTQQYYINVSVFILGLAFFPVLSGIDPSYVLPRVMFWGGIFGGIYTFYNFKRRNIWPLYDNLRYPKYLLFVGMFLALQVINYGINSYFF